MGGRSVLLYDVLLQRNRLLHHVRNGNAETGGNFTNCYSRTQNFTELVESPCYLLASAIFSSVATIPYILFIAFTLLLPSLRQPKNIFKSNFAASALIHLVTK